MLKALRNRSIALLWGGQAASAIGDEIYRVALIWLAVNLIGADTGYLAAGQATALLTLSLVGGKWADRWDHFRTMIWVDGLRAGVVLIPVALSPFYPISLPILWFMALTLAALAAFFDPALQATLPRFSPNIEILQAATGLMSTTLRLARVVGPAVIGLLTAVLPTVHFFTLDALSFAISAFSIQALRKHPTHRPFVPRAAAKASFRETIAAGFRAIRPHRTMRYAFFAKTVNGGAWALAYLLGLALYVSRIAPHDVRAFGWVVASYGGGNLAAALVVGNIPRRNPVALMCGGYVWMGAGFVLMALAPSLHWLMAAAALAAIGGPINDIPFVDLIQSRFPIDEIPKLFRLRMAVETGATVVVMLASPFLFREFAIPSVIGVCGAVTSLVGVLGLVRFREYGAPVVDSATRTA